MPSQIILEAYYRNGRFGHNHATVRLHDDGHCTFCDGSGDPWRVRDIAEAEEWFRDFMADKVPADALACRAYF